MMMVGDRPNQSIDSQHLSTARQQDSTLPTGRQRHCGYGYLHGIAHCGNDV
jgi:hypothetical protein